MPADQTSKGACGGAHGVARLKRWWLAYQWYGVVAAGVLALGLGCLGFLWLLRADGETPSFFDVLHPALQLFVLNSGAVLRPNWALEIARFLAPLTLGYAAVQAFFVVTLQRVQAAQLSLSREHVVVCGLGRKGLQLVRDFRERGKAVVVIDADGQNDHLRICRDLGALVLVGDATQVDLLRKARVPAASQVIATAGDDGVNVEIAVHAYRLFQQRPSRYQHPLQCLVHVVDETLYTVFRKEPMFQADADLFQVKIVNIYENGARRLLEEYPLDRVTIGAASPVTVHLVVIGFGTMGQSVALQAARIGHFANGRKLRITVVDKNADEVQGEFEALYPQFGQVCDVAYIQARAGSREVNESLERWAAEPDSLLTVAVCLDHDARSLTRALAVAEIIPDDKAAILVRMEEDGGLAGLLACEHAVDGVLHRVRPFGQVNQACALDRLLSDRQDAVASRVHEHYLVVARTDPNKKPDDESLRDWATLPEPYKDANRHVADHVDVKLRAVGLPAGKDPGRDFTKDELDLLSKMEHARWMADRMLAGWRYASGPKDERHKTNPNMIPWDQLDDVNREKDRQSVRDLRHWFERTEGKRTGVS